MHPILFETKFFILHTVWLFFAAAVIIGVFSVIKFSLQKGLKLQFLSEHSFRLILWTLIGARILNLLFHYKTYFYELGFNAFAHLFYIWDKGLNFWGGIAAFFICLYSLCRKYEQNFWKWLDVLIPAAIIGLAITHLGAFFEGSNYGTPTSLPWGVNFESPSIKYAVPIHPTQIYATLYSIIIVTGLHLLGHHEKIRNIEKPGFLGLIGALAYSFFRFLEGFIRGDDTLVVFGIRVPQILALVALISTGLILYLRYNNHHLNRKKS